MPDAIYNTSPLLYLYRIQVIDWLPRLFDVVWTPSSVKRELSQGQERGYDVPVLDGYRWLKIADPRALPSEWLTLDLGAGELATMALALEYPTRIVLLDDALARRIAEAAGLSVWGTLRVLLEAKSHGWTERIEPLLDRLMASGMWMSPNVRYRILALAGESSG